MENSQLKKSKNWMKSALFGMFRTSLEPSSEELAPIFQNINQLWFLKYVSPKTDLFRQMGKSSKEYRLGKLEQAG